jgi:sulfane dehydrogenase subunit SoxC
MPPKNSLVKNLLPSLDMPKRRRFLTGSASVAATLSVTSLTLPVNAEENPLWMKTPGKPMSGYGTPSTFEASVKRPFASGYPTVSPGTGSSRTPHQALEGTITPSGLHFERHHNGVPDIDPLQHELLIHGLVERPLLFKLDALSRYPLVNRVHFIECSGNSGPNSAPEPPQITAGAIHGLASTSEWTGVPLALLLHEAGIKPDATWILAEGADAASMSRSIPLNKALDDAMIALYQNGERLRPEQGYPMRLLLPGWEGNTNVKWLRRLKLTQAPTFTKDETSKYTDLQKDGLARQFTFGLGVKSVITFPSYGHKLERQGLYEITGIAWTGAGRITRVEISTNNGLSWKDATLQGPVHSKSFTRFRLPWHWHGTTHVLQSRATDDSGAVQPTRTVFTAPYAKGMNFHNNYIQAWAIDANGSLSNVYT